MNVSRRATCSLPNSARYKSRIATNWPTTVLESNEFASDRALGARRAKPEADCPPWRTWIVPLPEALKDALVIVGNELAIFVRSHAWGPARQQPG